jgi:endonuclease YncB( thermonuclease family)
MLEVKLEITTLLRAARCRHWLAAAMLLGVVAGCSTALQRESGRSANMSGPIAVKVVSVTDGDTLRVDVPGWPDIVGRDMPVRVAGIDAPEVRGECTDEIKLARRATDLSESLLTRADQVELREIRRGKYFRLLAEVWVDGENLGDRLIEAGLARVYHGKSRKSWCD